MVEMDNMISSTRAMFYGGFKCSLRVGHMFIRTAQPLTLTLNLLFVLFHQQAYYKYYDDYGQFICL
jgi:hypothetical protein